ncbi:MAG: hypothetical protein RR355_03120, partial [Oscillospiraceae bacterium]
KMSLKFSVSKLSLLKIKEHPRTKFSGKAVFTICHKGIRFLNVQYYVLPNICSLAYSILMAI